jgi:hypothetical protein
MEKLAAVTINVPYKSAGNVILQKEVGFEVYKHPEYYCIRPGLNEMERRLANLPETLDFQIIDGKAVSAKGAKDGNYHVIHEIVKHLRAQNLLPF